MNYEAVRHEKWTETLLEWMATAGDNDQAELIIRIKDTEALERPQSQVDQDVEAVQQSEQRHSDNVMEDLLEFVHNLEDKGKSVKLLDTSWLTHSVLVTATPSIVEILTKRDDVDLIDVNTPVGIARSVMHF